MPPVPRHSIKARDPRIAALLAFYLSFTMTEPGGFFQYADNMLATLVLAVVAAQFARRPVHQGVTLPVEVVR